MRKAILLLKAVVLLIICTGTALAEPKNGFGLNAGMTSNNMSGTTTPGGIAYSYSSNGLSFGMDYQFAVSDRFSINPIFIISPGESLTSTLQTGTVFSDAQPPDSAGHGILVCSLDTG